MFNFFFLIFYNFHFRSFARKNIHLPLPRQQNLYNFLCNRSLLRTCGCSRELLCHRVPRTSTRKPLYLYSSMNRFLVPKLNNIIIHSMEYIPLDEAGSSSNCQDIHRLLWTRMFFNVLTTAKSPFPILIRTNPANHTSYALKTHFNIIILSTLLSFGFSGKILHAFLTPALRAACSAHVFLT